MSYTNIPQAASNNQASLFVYEARQDQSQPTDTQIAFSIEQAQHIAADWVRYWESIGYTVTQNTPMHWTLTGEALTRFVYIRATAYAAPHLRIKQRFLLRETQAMSKKRILSHEERGRLGGLATLQKYGPEHFAEIGRKGFQATAIKYFSGDTGAMTDWLRQKGWAAQAEAVAPGWGEFLDPGPFPF